MDTGDGPGSSLSISQRLKMANQIYRYKFLLVWLFMVTTMTTLSGAYDVYFLTYATKDGRTGHSALAVDNYSIYVSDHIGNGITVYHYDTVKTGTLTYFDFWPEEDHFSISNVGKDTKARYNRLPAASYDKEITLAYILSRGIPHIRNYPCDGILVYKTNPYEDYRLIHLMDSLISLDCPFNVRKFNCADFVLYGANHITGKKISAKEFVPFSFSTTPNRLYRKLITIAGMEVIVDPGEKVGGRFFKERIIEMILQRRRTEEIITNGYVITD